MLNYLAAHNGEIRRRGKCFEVSCDYPWGMSDERKDIRKAIAQCMDRGNKLALANNKISNAGTKTD